MGGLGGGRGGQGASAMQEAADKIQAFANVANLTNSWDGNPLSNVGSHVISCELDNECYHRLGTKGARHFLHTREIGFLTLAFSKFGRFGP